MKNYYNKNNKLYYINHYPYHHNNIIDKNEQIIIYYPLIVEFVETVENENTHMELDEVSTVDPHEKNKEKESIDDNTSTNKEDLQHNRKEISEIENLEEDADNEMTNTHNTNNRTTEEPPKNYQVKDKIMEDFFFSRNESGDYESLGTDSSNDSTQNISTNSNNAPMNSTNIENVRSYESNNETINYEARKLVLKENKGKENSQKGSLHRSSRKRNKLIKKYMNPWKSLNRYKTKKNKWPKYNFKKVHKYQQQKLKNLRIPPKNFPKDPNIRYMPSLQVEETSLKQWNYEVALEETGHETESDSENKKKKKKIPR